MTTSSLPGAAGAEQIMAALRQSGVVDAACVSHVAVTGEWKKLRSHTLRLNLSYEGAAADVPRSLILKMGHLGSDGRSAYANQREIAFYRDVAPAAPLTPRCFAAADATDTSAWHLLLEDLTDSHFIATAWPLPPARAQYESILRALARFHATWWDSPRLGVSIGSWRDAAFFDRDLRDFEQMLGRFTDRFGELLPRARRELYRLLLVQAPRLLARYNSRRNLTVIHGDAHPWNFFLPRDAGSVRLIDWENWSIDTATDDLAYMMAMLWYPDRRRAMEGPLLDLYYAALLENGVSGYDRQALADDYRLSVLWLIMRPVWQAMHNIGPAVWWNNLERIMLAVDDLGCRDLLG